MPATLLSAPLAPRGVSSVARGLIRPATRADASAIAEVYHASYDGEWTAVEAREDIERAFDGGHGRLLPSASLVVTDGRDHIVGAVLTVLDAPWEDAPRGPFVIDLFVDPAHRGAGLGRSLMLAAMAGSPGDAISLRVEPGNTVARALYATLGFVPAVFEQPDASRPDGGGVA